MASGNWCQGLFQERAYVCVEVRIAAAARIVQGSAAPRSRQHSVIRADEPQVLLGRVLNKLVMDPLESFGPLARRHRDNDDVDGPRPF